MICGVLVSFVFWWMRRTICRTRNAIGLLIMISINSSDKTQVEDSHFNLTSLKFFITFISLCTAAPTWKLDCSHIMKFCLFLDCKHGRDSTSWYPRHGSTILYPFFQIENVFNRVKLLARVFLDLKIFVSCSNRTFDKIKCWPFYQKPRLLIWKKSWPNSRMRSIH